MRPISGTPWCSKTSITSGSKSVQELEVFLCMSLERLRLCCGIQCTDSLHPNGPRNSSQQLSIYCGLQLELRLFIVKMRHKGHYMQPSCHSSGLNGHVLATFSAVVLALCEGRTGLAISGVFGAGKTLSAAALLAGLLVFLPTGTRSFGRNRNVVSNLVLLLNG